MVKLNRKYHIRRTGTGKGKLRHNPIDLRRIDVNLLGGRTEVDLVIESLNPLERMWFNKYMKSTPDKDKALEVIVNTVEGDDTQLGPRLRKYAKKKGWLDGWENVSY
jgi:hypothetical protein